MIPDFKSSEERSAWIIANADMFTVIRFHGRGKYERHEFKDISSAETAARRMAAKTGARYLLYACAGIYDTFTKAIYPKQEG